MICSIEYRIVSYQVLVHSLLPFYRVQWQIRRGILLLGSQGQFLRWEWNRPGLRRVHTAHMFSTSDGKLP